MRQLLDRICDAHVRNGRVVVEAILQEVGVRSFGPLFLFAGVILTSPVSGIPGMPTTMGILVLLVSAAAAVQARALLAAQVAVVAVHCLEQAAPAAGWLRRPARFVDRWLRPQLTLLVSGRAKYFVAASCTCIAALVPFMEFVPFSASLAGLALASFGLALTAGDGLFALVASS